MSSGPRHVSARIALLDQQIVDRDRLPIGRVDDVELAAPSTGAPLEVDALLTGSQALGRRLGGLGGRLMAAAAERLRSAGPGPTRLDADLVEEIAPLVKLRVPLAELTDVAGLERWLGERVARLPGAGDAVE